MDESKNLVSTKNLSFTPYISLLICTIAVLKF